MDELLRQWQRNSITPEQAIGYMLQHLVLLYQRDGQRGERLADQSNQSDQSNPPAPEPKRKRR